MREQLSTFKALGDASRVRILNMLTVRSLCVCEIAAVLDLAQSTVSRHLRVLEEAGFLERSKKGLWVNYRLADGGAGSIQRKLLGLIRDHFSDDLSDDLSAARSVDRDILCKTS